MSEKLKILIIEDEEFERKGLRYYLEEKLPDISFFESISGFEALEVFNCEKPQIVLIDIKIPGLDGLSVAQKMKKILPETNVIIITGFNEFDFAKKAIKIDVIDYLLKPVDLEKLHSIILRLIKKIEKNVSEIEKNKELEKVFEENLVVLKQSFIRSIILGYEFSEDEISKKSLIYNLKADNYCLFLFTLSNLDKVIKLDDEKKRQVLKLDTLKIVEDYLKKYSVYSCFEIFENIFAIVIGNIALKNHFKIYSESIKNARDIQKILNLKLEVDVDFGISNHSHNIGRLDSLFKEAKIALEQKIYLEKNSISHIKDLTGGKEHMKIFPKKLELELLNSFEFGEIENILVAKDEIFKYFLTNNEFTMSIRRIVTELMFLIFRNIKYDDENFLLSLILNDYFEKIIRISAVADIEMFFEEFLIKLKNEISKLQGERHKSIAEQAKSYIIENLSQDLNLSKVAEIFCLSPCYFSYIFKKELGVNFSEFIIKERIEKAKILLKNVKKNVSDVSREAGYQDTSYFSYIFKKSVGLTPSKFRNANTNNIKNYQIS